MKWIMVLLGLGLATLGAAGVDRSAGLVAWLDLALAMVAVLAGVTVRAYPRLRHAPLFVGGAVIAVALFGMMTSAPWWLLRWNLFLGVGLVLDGTFGLRTRSWAESPDRAWPGPRRSDETRPRRAG
jgi:hypothetical protein